MFSVLYRYGGSHFAFYFVYSLVITLLFCFYCLTSTSHAFRKKVVEEEAGILLSSSFNWPICYVMAHVSHTPWHIGKDKKHGLNAFLSCFIFDNVIKADPEYFLMLSSFSNSCTGNDSNDTISVFSFNGRWMEFLFSFNGSSFYQQKKKKKLLHRKMTQMVLFRWA